VNAAWKETIFQTSSFILANSLFIIKIFRRGLAFVEGVRREVIRMSKKVFSLFVLVFLMVPVLSLAKDTNLRVNYGMIYQKLIDIEKRLAEMEKRQAVFEERFKQMDKRFEDMNRRFEDMNKRFEEMMSFLKMIVGIFTALVVALIGFAYWDRRTIIRKARDETIEFLEREGKLRKLIDALKELAKEDRKLAEVLRSFGLL